MSSAPPALLPLEHYDGSVKHALQLAARVGRHGKDGADVSYTSLFIALLWLEDDTSKWLLSGAASLGARLAAVYQTRNVTESDQPALRAAAFSREELNPLTYTPSARRVLAAAQEIANESSQEQPGLVSTRHIAAVYFFRNPPDHQSQLESEWGFNPDKWRDAFVEFVSASFAGEAGRWEWVFAPYLDPEALQRLPIQLTERYRFAPEALAIITAWSNASVSNGSHLLLRSMTLADTLFAAGAFGQTSPDRRPEPDSPPSLKTAVALAADSRLILDGAQSLAFTTTEPGEIGLRHLEAAVLLIGNSDAHHGVALSVKPVITLRQELLRRINRNHLEDDSREWHKALVGQREPDLAVYRPDDPEQGEDQLDVRRFAAAFALLIASKEVLPPLAFGISGNWGSGKSFFMRLMRKETERITAKAEADPRFLSNVVPIQFNAWHYAEKDLLASLVQTIFQSLQGALIGPGGGPSAAEAVKSRLEQAKAERDKADKAAEEAEAALERSRQKLESAKRQAELESEQAKLTAAEVAAASADQLKGALGPLGLGYLESLIDQGKDRAVRVRKALDEVEATGLRGRSAVDWLLRAPVHWPGVFAVLFVFGLTAAVLWAFRNQIQQGWPVIMTVLTELGAVAGLVWRWASTHMAKVHHVLDGFDKVRAAIDAKVEEKQAAIAQPVEAAEAELKAEEEKVEQARKSADAAAKGVEEAERAVEETKSINRLARLVDERLTSRDYEKYLGLVAAVRADFQRLSDLIHAAAKEAEDSKLSFRRIDRIVLYIDDLDRCPTDKVILVLEAIHLLLAFDLFVVVVGLDIRWASHSLEEKFERHLKSNGGATALDYLEKIFQVPFWLPPMDEQASRQLLTTMLPGQTGAAKQAQQRPAARGGKTAAAAQPQSAQQSGTAATQAAVNETELLSIQRGERAFMLQLAPAVSRSPRRLKRFVNTYLILRASLDPVEREWFVLDGGERGNYREAMMLLALLTAAPQAWTRVLEALDSPAGPESVADLRKLAVDPSAAGEREYVEAAFDIYRSGAESMESLKLMAPKVARFSFHYSFS